MKAVKLRQHKGYAAEEVFAYAGVVALFGSAALRVKRW